jgi:hypothetical protein
MSALRVDAVFWWQVLGVAAGGWVLGSLLAVLAWWWRGRSRPKVKRRDAGPFGPV